MARKRKEKRSNSVYLFICIVVAICLAYEPLTSLTEQGVTGDTPEQQDRANSQQGTQERKPLSKMPEKSSGMELPASLKESRSELILERMGYTVSFNAKWNLPNWVAWELNRDKLVERESRNNKFLPDPDLQNGKAVTTDDYTNSGYDRGHMCPAGDNRWHWRAMQESFYMTNICPQDHNLNRGDWKELEEKCRTWAEQEGSIYIVCGPILYKKKHQSIGKEHRILVPEAFFKVVLSLNGDQPKAAGFIFKNSSGNRKLSAYINTVDEVERITGIDFFPRLPNDVEQKVEAEIGSFSGI